MVDGWLCYWLIILFLVSCLCWFLSVVKKGRNLRKCAKMGQL